MNSYPALGPETDADCPPERLRAFLRVLNRLDPFLCAPFVDRIGAAETGIGRFDLPAFFAAFPERAEAETENVVSALTGLAPPLCAFRTDPGDADVWGFFPADGYERIAADDPETYGTDPETIAPFFLRRDADRTTLVARHDDGTPYEVWSVPALPAPLPAPATLPARATLPAHEPTFVVLTYSWEVEDLAALRAAWEALPAGERAHAADPDAEDEADRWPRPDQMTDDLLTVRLGSLLDAGLGNWSTEGSDTHTPGGWL